MTLTREGADRETAKRSKGERESEDTRNSCTEGTETVMEPSVERSYASSGC
jgi:hypothetical protein